MTESVLNFLLLCYYQPACLRFSWPSSLYFPLLNLELHNNKKRENGQADFLCTYFVREQNERENEKKKKKKKKSQ